MQTVNDPHHRVKTISGYWFTEVNGRYGRTYGKGEKYEPLCESCATNLVDWFRGAVPELQAELETVETAEPCAVCAREEKTK